MTIETRYNVGDEVWIRTLTKNYRARIIGITANIRTDGDIILEYGLERKGYYYQKRECDLFPTKEESKTCKNDTTRNDAHTSHRVDEYSVSGYPIPAPRKKARPRRPNQGDVYARLHRGNRYGVVRPCR